MCIGFGPIQVRITTGSRNLAYALQSTSSMILNLKHVENATSNA